MWYSKMYFSEKREFFQFDASGTQGAPATCREFPFLESLLTFLEMDCQQLTPPLKRISHNWNRLIAEDDRQAGTEAMVELAQLGQRHIYLELLYVRWYDRFSRMGIYDDRGSAEDQQMLDELQRLPQQLPLHQKQIQRFFDLVLDVDSAGRNPQLQASQNYLYDAPKDPELFPFRPIPLSFEPVEPGRCSPVLYSSSISDMIDYSLRSCVERGITVRRCRTAAATFLRPDGSALSTASAPWRKDSRPAGKPGPSSNGPKSSPMIPSLRLTGRNTRSVLPGSRQGVSQTLISTPGANRPER